MRRPPANRSDIARIITSHLKLQGGPILLGARCWPVATRLSHTGPKWQVLKLDSIRSSPIGVQGVSHRYTYRHGVSAKVTNKRYRGTQRRCFPSLFSSRAFVFSVLLHVTSHFVSSEAFPEYYTKRR